MKKGIKQFLIIGMVISIIICTLGCGKEDKTPKGMSSEMYGYTKEISTKVHEFLDGDIERSETNYLVDKSQKIADLIEKENKDGSLVEKYYNDEEAAKKALNVLLYLNAKDGIDTMKTLLSELDEMLADK